MDFVVKRKDGIHEEVTKVVQVKTKKGMLVFIGKNSNGSRPPSTPVACYAKGTWEWFRLRE